ncbi:leucine-rich repeat-containing protein 45 isoform X1 [Lethenteron reissneri]|uniref:leucine-rich repeat-containing protein 45 isoform X1 n=1 Tax=Lethenteron reissneri TaxID=7753 RepID=UPI002AB6359D|nr:leucine-rich repeat-containing protein 45 isoform X1 [Lethenteron reissneri]XP_061413647.1 leucine-rich repeat-containing protein 45 isoform X1 [Lethenteron reissneri]XP_061413656.1 leucine-rich repeat-containing protein 45 isoform X1 [Lethenteron reissneri]
MDALRRLYVALCTEGRQEPLDCVLRQMREDGASQGSGDSDGARLDLAGQGVPADACAVLGRALADDSLFAELSLADCMLSEEGAAVLVQGLCSNVRVRVLDLKGNNLRARGAEALAKLLRQNGSIQRLILEWNSLGVSDASFSLLAESLGVNSSLVQLDLRNNQIDARGAGDIATALRRNGTLQELDLRWNNLGLLGGRALLEGLLQNRALVRLEAAGNNIPSDVIKAMEQAVGRTAERNASAREAQGRTQLLTREIGHLQHEHKKQFLDLMDTIERQKEEMARSNRTSVSRLGQLHSALDERKSAVDALTARLQMSESNAKLGEHRVRELSELLRRTDDERVTAKKTYAHTLAREREEWSRREGKLQTELSTARENNIELQHKAAELERRCHVQQEQIFQLKQDLTHSAADLRLRVTQAEERVEEEKKRFKQSLEDAESLRQKEVEHMSRHQSESERCLLERVQRLENTRLALEEDLCQARAALVTERARAEEELAKARSQARHEERQRTSQLEERCRLLGLARDEAEARAAQHAQAAADAGAKNARLLLDAEALKRRAEELSHELAGKREEVAGEVQRVRLEMQEKIGHLEAERTHQEGLREKIAALERQLKGQASSHRESLRDRDSEIASLRESVRAREAEATRAREEEAQRARGLQAAVLTYLHGAPALSPLAASAHART